MEESKKKRLAFGNVNEVKEVGDKILMPLTPIDNRYIHFFATIIYDLTELGYKKEDFKNYFKDILKKNSLSTILTFVKDNGRMIWSKVKGEEIIIKVWVLEWKR